MTHISVQVPVTPQMTVERQTPKKKEVSGYWSTTDKETEMFDVSLAVCVSDEAAMQRAGSETNSSVRITEADMRGDASVIELVFFLWGFDFEPYRSLL